MSEKYLVLLIHGFNVWDGCLQSNANVAVWAGLRVSNRVLPRIKRGVLKLRRFSVYFPALYCSAGGNVFTKEAPREQHKENL